MFKSYQDNMLFAFPTPIFYRECSGYEKMNEKLTKLIWKLEEALEDGFSSAAYQGGFYTPNFTFKEDYDGFDLLRPLIIEAIQHYVGQVRMNETRSNVKPNENQINLWGWLAMMEEGHYQVPHVHPDAHISGCYFFKAPPELEEPECCLDFLAPYDVKEMAFFKGARNSFCRLVPRAGTLVLFPSFCRHFFHPIRKDGELLFASFNAKII